MVDLIDTIKLPMLEFTYEDLVCAQNLSTRKILSSLEISWDDVGMNFNELNLITLTSINSVMQ